MTDVAKQEHYTKLSPEPIDVIRAWKLGFNLGNVVKYIGRCETKGDKLLDLKKARQYLDWEIEQAELQAACDKVVGEAAAEWIQDVLAGKYWY